MKRALVILRHERSLGIVRAWMEEHGIACDCVALDPVDLPGRTEDALSEIKTSIARGVDIIVLGTKVYDPVKKEKTDPPERLIAFLALLKAYGAARTPVCLTHLADMPSTLAQDIVATGLNVGWVDNDNLGRDGMDNLGPMINARL